ncbi:MAG: hypothetical protein HXX20_08915 [Chloroflexi bacterium]|nr:hypothetical protein [Chloroflexota bacterium]
MRVDENQIEMSEDYLIYLFNGEPFTGVGYELYPSGNLWTEQTYKDGILEGSTREWFPSGQLKSETHLENGGTHSVSRSWYVSGQLESEKYYEYGILIYSLEWNENGQVTKETQLKEGDSLFSYLLKQRNKTQNTPI